MSRDDKPASEQTKENAGVMLPPALKAALKAAAKEDDKSFSKLCAVLLQWSLDQMNNNQLSSSTLKRWTAVSPSDIHELESLRAKRPWLSTCNRLQTALTMRHARTNLTSEAQSMPTRPSEGAKANVLSFPEQRLGAHGYRVRQLLEIVFIEEELKRKRKVLVDALGEGGQITTGHHSAVVHNGRLIIR